MRRIHRLCFWDRAIDDDGRIIRTDVRKAAQEVWPRVCRMTRAVLRDSSEAAEILEECVARASRNLDARGHPLFTQRTEALLLLSVRNQLYTRAEKQRRLEVLDTGDASSMHLQYPGWNEKIERCLALESVVRGLSKRSREILMLRLAGYEWKEIAVLMVMTVANAKNTFWRELRAMGLSQSQCRRPQPLTARPRSDSHAATGEAPELDPDGQPQPL